MEEIKDIITTQCLAAVHFIMVLDFLSCLCCVFAAGGGWFDGFKHHCVQARDTSGHAEV